MVILAVSLQENTWHSFAKQPVLFLVIILNLSLKTIFQKNRFSGAVIALYSIESQGYLDCQTPEECWRAQLPKHCHNNNKNEDISLNVHKK